MSDEKVAIEKAVAAKVESKDEPMGLDAIDDSEQLKLITTEKEEVMVSKKLCMQSNLIKTMVEGDKDTTVVPLPNIKAPILAKVLDYLKHHTGNPAKAIEQPLKSWNIADVVSPWDAAFIDVEQELLFELILAANYMDIKPLLDLTCAKCAIFLKGKSAEDIRKLFNITNDFTPEEEEDIIQENKWADES